METGSVKFVRIFNLPSEIEGGEIPFRILEDEKLQRLETEGKLAPKTKSMGKAAGHQCTACKATYKTVSYLNVHYRSKHLGQVFQCDLCPKRYKKAWNLQQHVDTTHRQKTWTCTACGQTLKYGAYWERKHKDRHCPNKAPGPNKNVLKRHANATHQSKTWTCTACCKTFQNKSSLWNHPCSQWPVKQ